MTKACVIGHPVAHSRSPLLHRYWLKSLGIQGAYELADITATDFPRFLTSLQARGYAGANITVPHKEAAYRTVDRHDPDAQAVGAVNTVWHKDGQLVGGNTDSYGFLAHLDHTVPDWTSSTRQAVVLGAGGAARAIVHGLLGRGVAVALVNRTFPRGQDLAAHFTDRAQAYKWEDLPQMMAHADLLVNATSLGMAGKPPLAIDLAPLKPAAIVYDIVYVPLETPLLAAARQRGHRTIDGLGMLLHQAVPAFARWFGTTPEVTPDLRALLEADLRTSEPGHQ